MSDTLTAQDILVAQAEMNYRSIEGDYWIPVPWIGFQYIDASAETARRLGTCRTMGQVEWRWFYQSVRLELGNAWKRMIRHGEVGQIFGTRTIRS
jgi:hypothetical protein